MAYFYRFISYNFRKIDINERDVIFVLNVKKVNMSCFLVKSSSVFTGAISLSLDFCF